MTTKIMWVMQDIKTKKYLKIVLADREGVFKETIEWTDSLSDAWRCNKDIGVIATAKRFKLDLVAGIAVRVKVEVLLYE